MSRLLTAPAPAKLNLFLHILGRRFDGYHRLQTLFQFLDHGDRLTFEPIEDDQLELIAPGLPIPASDNLIMRAARLLKRDTGCRLGARIQLDKRLPMGGGLGGGSSDAATTLVMLNRLWRLQLPPTELARLALELGADVPLFTLGRAAWGEGIGEQLTPVQLEEPWYLVLTPDCEVATGAIFQHPELTRNSEPITMSAFLEGSGRNDFEPLVRKLHPQIDAAFGWLGEFAQPRLTGSGSSLFARFATEEAALWPLRQLPSGWRAFVARGCNTSPLYLKSANE